MKIKLFVLSLISVFMSFVITKQNELIKIPKEERQLKRSSEKILEGNVISFNDGDSFIIDGNIRIRLFGIDAPELNQTCLVAKDYNNINNNDTIDPNLQNNNTIQQNSNTNNQPLLNNNGLLQNIIQPKILNDNKDHIQNNLQNINSNNFDIIKCGEDAKNKLIKLIGNNKVVCLIKGIDAYGRMVGECNFETYNKRSNRKYKVNINREMVLSGYAVAFQQISDKYVEDENKARQDNNGIWATTFENPSVYRNKQKNN